MKTAAMLVLCQFSMHASCNGLLCKVRSKEPDAIAYSRIKGEIHAATAT